MSDPQPASPPAPPAHVVPTPAANNPLGTDTAPELIPGKPLLVRWNPEWPSFRTVTQVDIWLCSKPNYPDSCRPIQVQVPNELATTGISYDVPAELPADQEWLLLVTPNGATRGDFARLNAPTFSVRVAASTAPKPPVSRPSPTTAPPVQSVRPDTTTTPGTGAVVDPASPTTSFPVWAISLLAVAAFALLVLVAVMVRRRRSQSQSADRGIEAAASIPPVAAARDRSSRTSSELSFGPSRSDLGIVALV